MILIQAVSFLKKNRISGLPQRPALGADLLRQLTQAQGEEDPVTKHKGGPRAPFSNLQTLSLATGVFSEQFLHRAILFMLIGPGLVTGQCGAGEPPLPWGSHAHCPLKAWGLGGAQHSIPTLPFLLVCVAWILGKSLDGMMRWQLFSLVVLGWE